MKTEIINVKKDFCTGELGLVLEGISLSDIHQVTTLDGTIIAHDLIEHQRGKPQIGCIDDELEALGACMYVRGQFGYLQKDSYHPPVDGLASDIAQLFNEYANNGCLMLPTSYTHSTPFDIEYEYMVEEGTKISEYEDDDIRIIKRKLAPEFQKAAMYYLRRGYFKVKRRFNNNYTQANSVFWNIADAVDQITNDIYAEGQQFKLKYDRCNAWCEEYYEYDDY